MKDRFMKKLNIFALILSLSLIVGTFSGCGDEKDPVREALTDNVTVEPSGDESTTDNNISNTTNDGTSSIDDTSVDTTVDSSSSEVVTSEDVTDNEEKTTEPTTAPTTEPPATTTKPPVTTTKPPATTTKPPATTTKPPATTTKPPATTTQETTTSAPVVDYNVDIQEPVASGTAVSDMNGYVIDYSNMQDGYVMIKATTSATAVVQIYLDSKSGTLLGQYFIDAANTYLAFPLTKGANTYCVRVLEQNANGKYAQKNAITEYAAISPETKAYIHPNMYVDFNINSTAVRLSCELCAGKTTAEAKVKAIYDYIIKNIDYDYDFAKKVAANAMVGYMDAERCLKNKKGICGDYSVLFATMCRAQGIPCMVVEGYVTTTEQIFHAWNKVYLNGAWKFYDTTFDAGGGKGKSYIEVYFY